MRYAKQNNTFPEKIDNLIGIFSPKTAYNRKAYRFAYDLLDGTRTRKKRNNVSGTQDTILTEYRLSQLRAIARDLSRNNPLAKGLLKIERDGVVGSGPKIHAQSADEKWNEAAETLWLENMVKQPCDTTGRFNFNKYIRTAYLSYRRDGDFLTIFTDDGLQAVESEQIGSPAAGIGNPKHYKVVNGVAFSKLTGRNIGFFVGKPGEYGYISPGSFSMIKAKHAHLMYNPERFSQSRGEPILTPSVDLIDKLSAYIDAEIVAAKVNACFTMFVSKNDDYGDSAPPAYSEGISSSGQDDDGNRLEKMEPGTILYGESGESATGIGQVRPGALFDPFTNKILAIIGRPLAMPLVLMTGDFSGATFMNMRIAYQKLQELWTAEQDDIIKPLTSRVYSWFIDNMIRTRQLTDCQDKYKHQVQCRRWPYVDPFKEAKADEQELKNLTTSRQRICDRRGESFEDVVLEIEKENKLLAGAGIDTDKGAKDANRKPIK